MTPADWTEAALDQLSDAYVAAGESDRLELVAAVMDVNRELDGRPEEWGESREGGRRVAFFGRLTVHFRLPPADGPSASVKVIGIVWRAASP
jgi:hypothetical protein